MIVEPAGENDFGALKSKQFHLFAFLISFLVALPLLSTTYLTLFDYPNHVARYGLIGQYQNSAVFKDFFVVNPRFIPNLGFDILAVNLCKVFPLAVASQLIIFGAIFFSSLGFCYLAKHVQGRTTWLAFLPSVFLWSFSLIFGFNNYVLGLCFLPWSLLFFDQYCEKPRPQFFLGYLVFTVFAFVCHAQVAALTVAFAFVFAISREMSWPQRRIMLGFAFLPVLCLLPLLAISPSSGEFSKIQFGGIKHKIRMIGQVFLTGSLWTDLLFLLGLAATAAYLFLAKQVSITQRALRVLIACIAICFLTPTKLAIATNLDTRVVPIALAIAAASLVPTKRLSPVLMFLVPGLILFRSATAFVHLQSSGVVAQHVEQQLDHLPTNAVVFNVVADSNHIFNESEWSPPILNLAYYGMWKRPLYVSGLYAYPNQQPLLYSETGNKLDYLGILNPDQPQGDVGLQLKTHLTEIHKRMGLVPSTFWQSHVAYVFIGTTFPVKAPLPTGMALIYEEPKFLIAKLDPFPGVIRDRLQ